MANFYVSSDSYGRIKPWGGFTNLFTYSQTFSNAAWVSTNLSDPTFSTTTTAPDGTNTAVLLTENTTNGVHDIYQTIAGGTAQTYVFSIYAKPGPGRSRILISLGDGATIAGANSTFAFFDLATGYAAITNVVLSGPAALNFGTAPAANGFTRCYLVVRLPATVTTIYAHAQIDSNTGQSSSNSSYAGTNGQGVYIWGAQLERGTHMGKYTATTSAAATTVGSFAASVGDLVRQSASFPGAALGIGSVGAERVFRCTTAGTTGANEPSASAGNPWAIGRGQTTIDGTAVWTEVTGQEAYSSPNAWCASPRCLLFTSSFYATGSTVSAGGTGFAVGDVVRVSAGGGPVGDYAYFKVAAVSSGVVTSLTLLSGGFYTTQAVSVSYTAVTGSGTGLTGNLTNSSGNWGQVAGDTIFVGSAHAESMNAAYTFSPASGANLICVDETASGAVPPGSGNLKTSAVVSTVGANSLTINAGLSVVDGVAFVTGSGTSAVTFTMGQNGYYRNGSLALPTTAASTARVAYNVNTQMVFENVSVTLGSTSSVIQPGSTLIWRSSKILSTGSVIPTAVFNASNGPQAIIEGCDLSNVGSNSLVNVNANGGSFVFKNCLLSSGSVAAANTSSAWGQPRVALINCDSGLGYYRNELYRYAASLTTDPTVTRTGGASDSGTAISHKITTASALTWGYAFEAFPIAIWNATTGSTVTVTVCGIANAAALPTNDQFWLQVSYLGSSASPLATINNATKANALATGAALTADASAWDSNVTARANSTAYTVGQTIKTSSNAGRVFFCTSAGTSAASEPGGYASAVDGGSVTDGTATFRAGVRFKQSVALSSPTPQAAGLITVTPKVGAPSATYYVDPLVTLS